MGDIIIQIYGEKGCINHDRQTKIETSLLLYRLDILFFKTHTQTQLIHPQRQGCQNIVLFPVVKCAITTTKDLDIGCPQTRSNHANLR